MELTSLSASSIRKWSQCPAQWAATYANGLGERPADESGPAAKLGTAVHNVLQEWVEGGHYQLAMTASDRTDFLGQLFDQCYWDEFEAGEGSMYDTGLEMVLNWVENQSWVGRRVLSTEQRETFELPTSAGPVKVTYIIDRLDQIDNGDLEVTDYKTGVRNVRPDTLHDDPQCRLYALAVQKKFPKATRIWVTLDQTRHGKSSTLFTTEDNRETWEWLIGIAESVIAGKEPEEKLCSTCRWCPRRYECKTLDVHQKVGGPQSVTDIDDAAEMRDKIKKLIAAHTAMATELDDFIITEMDRLGEEERLTENGVTVKVHSKVSTKVNSALAVQALQDHVVYFVQTYGNINVKSIQKALADPHTNLPDDVLRDLDLALDKTYGASSVVTL